jgi:hypothetical protein
MVLPMVSVEDGQGGDEEQISWSISMYHELDSGFSHEDKLTNFGLSHQSVAFSRGVTELLCIEAEKSVDAPVR